MKGSILSYNEKTKEGLISAENGERYTFILAEWKPELAPRSGTTVDFSVQDNNATEIFSITSGAASGGSKRIAASLLAFFLGNFGAHKFYLGYKKQGIIMLLCSLSYFISFFISGFILLLLSGNILASGVGASVVGTFTFFLLIAMRVIGFIEFILYIIKSDEEFERTYVSGNKPWF